MIILRNKKFSIKSLKNNIAFNEGLEVLKRRGGMKAIDGMSPKRFAIDMLKSGRHFIKNNLGTGVNKSINKKASKNKLSIRVAKKIIKDNRPENSGPILNFE